ncbi:MAG: radical SAM protein [Methanolobus sp.]|nr:radical SAM protein [Methanolobus sp.]
MIMEKNCGDHGSFREIYWSDAKMFEKFERFAHVGSGLLNPNISFNSDCPFQCGLCISHRTTTILANIDVTNRCNMSCPVCFANARSSGRIYEPSKVQIYDMMTMLRSQKPVPCCSIQFSGGEPTVREDLHELVKMAKDFGFVQIQVASNGIKFAQSVAYGEKLVEAGMQTLYLQFDGMSPEPYIRMRGFDALPLKLKAIDNARKAGLRSITLVPTLAKDINDHQVGDIIRFAAKNRDVVKGVNFQPVSFTGRICQEEREKNRITIPDLAKLAEEQTGGEIPRDAWYPVPFVVPISQFLAKARHKALPEMTVHPHCGAATYLFVDNDRIVPITDFVDVEGLMEMIDEASQELNDNSRNLFVIGKVLSKVPGFIDSKKEPDCVNVTKMLLNVLREGGSSVVQQFHRESLFLGAMHFQDMYNFDVERIQRCGIHYATPDGKVIPFCTYNTLHRESIEAKYSKPYVPAKHEQKPKLKNDVSLT